MQIVLAGTRTRVLVSRDRVSTTRPLTPGPGQAVDSLARECMKEALLETKSLIRKYWHTSVKASEMRLVMASVHNLTIFIIVNNVFYQKFNISLIDSALVLS